MSTLRGRVRVLAERQHGAVGIWQLDGTKNENDAATRGLRRVYRGVCALDDLTELGWLMAATLAMGPGAAISHRTAVFLWRLRDWEPGEIHVSVPRGGGRADRPGIVPHRRNDHAIAHRYGIPVTTPAQSLHDADLQPHELYRALEEANRRNIDLTTLPLNDVVRLQKATKGRTRSDAEARFLLLCHDHHIPLPLVNHHLNGFETDFHWPSHRVAVEVDGYEFHKERHQFEEDRHRGTVHTIAGYHLIRFSANQVEHSPSEVLAAVRSVL
jgi:hypothetical protein